MARYIQYKRDGNNITLPQLAGVEVIDFHDPRLDQWLKNHRAECRANGTKPLVVCGTGHRPKDFPQRGKTTFAGPVSFPKSEIEEILAKPQGKQAAAWAKAREMDPMGLCMVQTMTSIVEAIAQELEELRVTAVIGGGAMGFDQLLIAAARRLQLPYLVFVPLETQASFWPAYIQKGWLTQAQGASLVVLTGHNHEASEGESPFQTDKGAVARLMDRRNKAMLMKSDRVVALWSGKRHGGTYNCIKDAARLGKPVHNLFEAVIMTHVRSEYRAGLNFYAGKSGSNTLPSSFRRAMADVKRHKDLASGKIETLPPQDIDHEVKYGPQFSYTRLNVNRASDLDLDGEDEPEVNFDADLASKAEVYSDIPF